MNTSSLRAKADQLLRKHGGTIDKGIASAEKFAKGKTRGDSKKARQVEKAASTLRNVIAKQQRPR